MTPAATSSSAYPASAASVRGVNHRFPGRGQALVDVDLDLFRGSVVALVGANGAGKTTLLRILAGLLAPAAGRVVVLGVESPAAARGRRARELRRRLAYVPQEVALDPEMTGGETLALLAALHGLARSARARRVTEVAGTFGIAPQLERRVATWSGGAKRRLHLAAGMLHEPELLLLDEPTAGLDLDGGAALWTELARRAAAGAAAAVATHELAAVERHAARVVILDEGRVAADAPPAELLARLGVSDLAAAYRRVTGRDASALVPRGGIGAGKGGSPGASPAGRNRTAGRG